MSEGEISTHEFEDVAEHFGFGVMRVEDWVSEEGGGAAEGRGDDLGIGGEWEGVVEVGVCAAGEGGEDVADVVK